MLRSPDRSPHPEDRAPASAIGGRVQFRVWDGGTRGEIAHFFGRDCALPRVFKQADAGKPELPVLEKPDEAGEAEVAPNLLIGFMNIAQWLKDSLISPDVRI